MSKTLILHIGHYKTGTTVLQVFFEENPQFLAAHGFQYPDAWMESSKHSDYAFSILRAAGVKKLMHGYSSPVTPEEMWGDLFRQIEEQEKPYTLISSEEFMRLGQFPKTRDILRQILDNRPAGLNIKVVAYLRSPGEHLQSWFNQLIKMGFKMSDMGSALNGEIEDIHYDYKHALQPWIDILGAENVLIRPYVKDLENPSALHQDFMGIFGISLVPGLEYYQQDLNPRLDDRIIDLVRMLQNLGFPQSTISTTSNRAEAYLDTQDRLLTSKAGGISTAAARAQDGLDWLADLPDNNIDTQAFARNLPTAAKLEEVKQNLLLGFIYSELIQLRWRLNDSNIPDAFKRIEALEQRLSEMENGK
ncbi:MAG: hypothetical protein ACI92Z_000159 [Paracoccaceae bacterium]|jgi:hypothetical protein